MRERSVRIIKDTIARYTGSDMSVYAGYATVGLLKAAFPLLMLLIAVINMIPGYSPQDFTEFVFRYLPDLPQVKTLFMEIMTTLQKQSSGLLASIAALTSLWSASAGVSAIQKGLKKIMPDAQKSVWDKPIALLATFFLVILLPAILLFNVMRKSLEDLLRILAGKFGFGWVIDYVISALKLSSVITAVAAILLILFLYTYLPGGKRKIRDQIPGAILTGGGGASFTELFSIAVPLFFKSALYGSLAVIFLVIMWLQILLSILFLGEALNQALIEARSGDGDAGAAESC